MDHIPHEEREEPPVQLAPSLFLFVANFAPPWRQEIRGGMVALAALVGCNRVLLNGHRAICW